MSIPYEHTVSWSYFPMQHIVQKGWRILIPYEDKLKLLPHLAYCPACLYDKASKTKDVLLGGRTSGLDGTCSCCWISSRWMNDARLYLVNDTLGNDSLQYLVWCIWFEEDLRCCNSVHRCWILNIWSALTFKHNIVVCQTFDSLGPSGFCGRKGSHLRHSS